MLLPISPNMQGNNRLTT